MQGDSWIIKFRSGNSTLCSRHANPVPPLSHPFWLCGFTMSCFPFSGSLCYVVFLIFRAWQAEKCDLGSSNRLQSLGTIACTDANILKVLVIWEPLSSSKANEPLFFSPLLPIALCFHLKIRQEYHFRNTFYALQQYSKLTAFDSSPKHPISLRQSLNSLPLHAWMHPVPLSLWDMTHRNVYHPAYGADGLPVQPGQGLGDWGSSHPSPPCLVPLCSLACVEITLLSHKLTMVESNTQVWRGFLVHCPENINEGILHKQHFISDKWWTPFGIEELKKI